MLPPHPLRVPHSAHLGVEAVGFAEVALAAFFVAKEAGKVSGFFAEEGGQQRVAISFDPGAITNLAPTVALHR